MNCLNSYAAYNSSMHNLRTETIAHLTAVIQGLIQFRFGLISGSEVTIFGISCLLYFVAKKRYFSRYFSWSCYNLDFIAW